MQRCAAYVNSIKPLTRLFAKVICRPFPHGQYTPVTASHVWFLTRLISFSRQLNQHALERMPYSSDFPRGYQPRRRVRIAALQQHIAWYKDWYGNRPTGTKESVEVRCAYVSPKKAQKREFSFDLWILIENEIQTSLTFNDKIGKPSTLICGVVLGVSLDLVQAVSGELQHRCRCGRVGVWPD